MFSNLVGTIHWNKVILKLKFYEKATKFEKKNPLGFVIYSVTCEIFSNFVGFSENINFIC